MRRRWAFWTLGLAVGMFLGCRPPAKPPSSSPQAEETTSGEETTPSPARTRSAVGEPEVQPVNRETLPQVLAQHRGKVVVLNFWATWCPPCVAEFPDLVRLQRDYQDRGLVVVFVSNDDPEDLTPVKDFLRQQGVDWTSYVKDVADDPAFIRSVSAEWMGGLPATFIYDRAGKQQEMFIGAQAYETFVQAVQPLLEGEEPVTNNQ